MFWYEIYLDLAQEGSNARTRGMTAVFQDLIKIAESCDKKTLKYGLDLGLKKKLLESQNPNLSRYMQASLVKVSDLETNNNGVITIQDTKFPIEEGLSFIMDKKVSIGACSADRGYGAENLGTLSRDIKITIKNWANEIYSLTIKTSSPNATISVYSKECASSKNSYGIDYNLQSIEWVKQ